MDTTKRIIEEAESLMDFLYDDVETLFPWAIPIIKHYKTLPLPSNQVYNRYLKEIGNIAGIPSITSHMGRRTFSTLLINKNVSLEAVAAALGDNPQIAAKYYAKVFDSTILTQQLTALK